MGKVKMSIQEGLSQLNTLTKRIDKALNQRLQFGAVVLGDKTVKGFKTNEKFDKDVKSAYDSVRSLMNRRTLIKRAIVKKNAEVVVDVGGQTMTIAEAIERKNSIEDEERLLFEMEKQYTQLMNELGNQNEYYRERLDRHLETALSGKDNKDKTKEQVLIEIFKEQNEPHFVDPIGLKDEIDKLDISISTFKEKVDNVLTTANVMNQIEFEDPSAEEVSAD